MEGEGREREGRMSGGGGERERGIEEGGRGRERKRGRQLVCYWSVFPKQLQ